MNIVTTVDFEKNPIEAANKLLENVNNIISGVIKISERARLTLNEVNDCKSLLLASLKENNFDKIEKSFKKLMQSVLTKKEFDAIFKVKQN